MTDYSISGGAVEAAWRHMNSARFNTLPSFKKLTHEQQETILAWEPNRRDLEDACSAAIGALTYYAEHPEELPQEVRDAVRGMGDG